MRGPLLTSSTIDQLRLAQRRGDPTIECTLDLRLSVTSVQTDAASWSWNGRRYPYPEKGNARTVYCWHNDAFEPVARFGSSLIKLVPTEFGPPTFEIDGIKMLPTARGSPYSDAQRKVDLIRPRGKIVLDTCGGLGYFAAWCVRGFAAQVLSFEKNIDVIWLRSINPWSPSDDHILSLAQADITEAINGLATQSIDAVLHDPPRFGTAGELYSRRFYDELSRVLKRKGRLFHYTGAPNKVSKGRDLAREVSTRLQACGFLVERTSDGVLAVKS